jgi:Fis family transcriptional regulator
MRRSAAPPERVLIVSESPLLHLRLERPLSAAGYEVQRMADPGELRRSSRQRPFLLCFLDARGCDAAVDVDGCYAARPGERYVLIRDAGTGDGIQSRRDRAEPEPVFGCLREPFSPEEVLLWVRRAATEAYLLRGDRSLDDLLYSKFRGFLQDLGPSSMTRFRDLMWERVERPLVRAVLEWTGGNQTRAAEVLGVHRNTLRSKIRALKLEASRRKSERWTGSKAGR